MTITLLQLHDLTKSPAAFSEECAWHKLTKAGGGGNSASALKGQGISARERKKTKTSSPLSPDVHFLPLAEEDGGEGGGVECT